MDPRRRRSVGGGGSARALAQARRFFADSPAGAALAHWGGAPVAYGARREWRAKEATIWRERIAEGAGRGKGAMRWERT